MTRSTLIEPTTLGYLYVAGAGSVYSTISRSRWTTRRSFGKERPVRAKPLAPLS
jgi:hypothetical protein